MDWESAEEDGADVRGAVVVGETGEVPPRMGDYEVRYLAGGDRTDQMCDSHRICGIERDGIECLDGSEAHPDAAESHHEAHVAGWGGAGIVVRGQGEPEAGVDEILRPAEGDAEEE